MTEPARRARKRPARFEKPAHWSDAPPPEPGPGSRHEDGERLDPTRFGDWEKDGVAVDF